MNAMSKRSPLFSRYGLTKFVEAVDDALSVPASMSQMMDRFQQSYNKQMTSVIAIAGAAMAPQLNKEAVTEPGAVERLVVRLIPRPTPRNIAVGDVVAFTSPLDHKALMVRRVAALEAARMVSDDADEEGFTIPPNNCWVLADNPQLEPPEVIDSRVFGYIPLDTIMGRIIYRVASREAHGPVANSPQAEAADRAVIEHEVDVEGLLGGSS